MSVMITIKPLVYAAPNPQIQICLVISLPNPLKPGGKLRMKMGLEQRRQALFISMNGIFGILQFSKTTERVKYINTKRCR